MAKARLFVVEIGGIKHLVRAKTCAGAINAATLKSVTAHKATEDEVFMLASAGVEIIDGMTPNSAVKTDDMSEESEPGETQTQEQEPGPCGDLPTAEASFPTDTSASTAVDTAEVAHV